MQDVESFSLPCTGVKDTAPPTVSCDEDFEMKVEKKKEEGGDKMEPPLRPSAKEEARPKGDQEAQLVSPLDPLCSPPPLRPSLIVVMRGYK